MTRPIIRSATLVMLFAAGVLSIIATAPPPEPYHFREVEIRPAYRCPGTDVSVHWKLSLPASVAVMLDGHTLAMTAADHAVVPAALLDGSAPDASLDLRIEAADDEAEPPATYDISTLRTDRQIDTLALRKNGMKFRTFHQDIWDDRVRIVAVSVKQVNYLLCARGAQSPPAWEVTPPSGESFLVHATDGYSASPVPVLRAGGIWWLRAKGGECRLSAIGQPPYLLLRLTASCSGAP